MACPNCGSWSVKADRSLGGRLVCGRCGQPLGAGGQGSRRRQGSRGLGLPRLVRWRPGRLLPWLVLLLGLGAALALLEPAAQPPVPAAPWPQPSGGAPAT